MVSRIQQGTTRPTTTPRTSGTTGPAAPKPGGAALKITSAAIDDGVKTFDSLLLPRGYAASTKELKAVDKIRLPNGKDATLDLNISSVLVRGQGGKSFALEAKENELADSFRSDFKSNFTGISAEDLESAGLTDWDAQRAYRGVGTAGKLMSVQANESSFTGGMYPNHYSTMTTYDARTGKAVKLEDLLSKQQMDGLVKSVGQKLDKLKMPADAGGGQAMSFGSSRDAADLREKINNGFALTTDANGKVKIELAWDSGVHALGGLTAHFSVDAPTDAAFKAKIGLE